MLGQALVDDQEVAVQEAGQRQVLAQHLAEELQRLALRAVAQGIVIGPVEIAIGRGAVVEVAHAQPLAGEAADELAGLRVGDHALDLRLQHRRFAQLVAARRAGRARRPGAAPEQVGQPAGELPGIDRLRDRRRGGRARRRWRLRCRDRGRPASTGRS